MTDVPWTPGPWRVDDGVARPQIAQTEPSGYIIAHVYQHAGPEGPNGESRTEANARLIAEAPAMAEVLDGTTGAFLAVLLENLAARLVMLGTAEDDDLVVEARHRAAKTRAILARIKGAAP